MTKYCKQFVQIRNNENNSFHETMEFAHKLGLFEKMTESDIKYLHKEGYIPAAVCSAALGALKHPSPHTETVAASYVQAN